MNFTYLLCAAVACVLFCHAGAASAKGKKSLVQEQKVELGVWEDVNKTASVDSIVRWMKPFDEAGVKNYYMCGTPAEVARYIEAARSYAGAKVHAWMFTVNAPGDSVALEHSEWFEVNRMGNNSRDYDPYVKHYKWLSPFVPEARQHMKDKAASYASLDGLASVHLDFIRFNDAILGRRLQAQKFRILQDTYRVEYDFGYHPLAIEQFKQQFGYSPLDLEAP